MTLAAERRINTRQLPKLLWPVMALAAILLFILVTNAGFFGVWIQDGQLKGNPVDILRNAVPVALLAIGMTLVIATGGVDLSVGAVMAISGTVSAMLISQHDMHLAPAVAIALAVSVACGLWNGLLVAYMGIQPIVATLVLMVSGRGIAQLLSDGQIITVVDLGYAYITEGTVLGVPFPVVLATAVFLVVASLTRKTALGLFVESVGNNPTASRYAGVNARAVKLMVYTLSGLCAGIAGLHSASEIEAADANNNGLYFELDAILAVLIGGTALTGGRFSLVGSVVGALIIQTTRTMILNSGIAPERTILVKAVVIIVISLFQAEKFRGLLGKAFGGGGKGAAQ